MRIFSPSVRALSYADNYAGLSTEGAATARGLACATACCDVLGLTLDDAKTYVWSTDSKHRQAMKAMHLTVAHHVRELGGFLSFGGCTRNAALVSRCRALDFVWKALARSKSPLRYKLAILPGKCWASALHGSSGVAMSDTHLAGLRTAAVRALRINPAGSSPIIRLSCCPDMTADPGFYRLWTSLQLFRRMLGKQPNLLLERRIFVARFDGKLLQGPLSQICACFAQLQWVILQPPLFLDHEGLHFSFTEMPEALLRKRAEDAWLQWVCSKVNGRKTMADLRGLEPSLLFLDSARLSTLDAARLAAIQSGAFLAPDQHAKFDLFQSGLCPTCRSPDTVSHRFPEPRGDPKNGSSLFLVFWIRSIILDPPCVFGSATICWDVEPCDANQLFLQCLTMQPVQQQQHHALKGEVIEIMQHCCACTQDSCILMFTKPLEQKFETVLEKFLFQWALMQVYTREGLDSSYIWGCCLFSGFNVPTCHKCFWVPTCGLGCLTAHTFTARPDEHLHNHVRMYTYIYIYVCVSNSM